jgi:hypothetical protein
MLYGADYYPELWPRAVAAGSCARRVQPGQHSAGAPRGARQWLPQLTDCVRMEHFSRNVVSAAPKSVQKELTITTP